MKPFIRSGRPLWPGIVACVAILAAGCSASDPPSTSATPSTAAPVAVQEGGTLVFAADTEPTAGLNNRTTRGNTPAVSTVMRRLWPFVWITTPDFKTVLNTDVVTSVDPPRGDPPTLVYRINPAATWSDGTPITCADFKYNIDILREGALGSSGEDSVDRVECQPDNAKVATVVLKQRLAEWRGLFTRPLIPAHIGLAVGWQNGFDRFDPAVVISGGPFRIESYNPGRDLTLVRNERYWGKPAALDSIVFRFVSDSSATMTALRTGEVDVIAPRVQADLVAELRTMPGVTHALAPGFDIEFVEFNLRNELLAIREVRQAFALALDRQAIVNLTTAQVDREARVANSRLFSTKDPAYADTSGGRYDRRDVAAARRLLEGAGFTAGPGGVYSRDGKPLSFRIRTTSGDSLREAQIEAIQSQVREAGFDLRIDNAPTAALVSQLSQGEFDIVSLGQGLSLYPSTTNSTFGTGGSLNNTKYSSTRVDELYAAARTELDDARRIAILHDIDRTLWDDLPRLPLYQRYQVVAFQDKAVNVGLNPSQGVLWNAHEWAVRAK